ncbi:MAG: glycosyltransferase [Geminicoccaceae bacterium]|nr:glycosyltransferase [Geminicoccaceae bacterium]
MGETDEKPWLEQGYNRVPRPMNPGKAPRRLEILFLYSRPPLPMTRGDELTVSHLIEFFYSRGHVIDFITLASPGQTLRADHMAWLQSRCRRVEIVTLGRLESMINAIRGVLRGWPLQIGLLLSGEQRRKAQEAVAANAYDLAYAYYIRSAEVLHAVKDRVPVSFMALQLAQTLNTERLSQTSPRWIERLFYRFESARMARYEAKIWQGVTRTVLIGNKDVNAIRDVCRKHGEPPIDNHVFGPHGVDTEQFKPADPALAEPETLVMSGVMRYAPNVEAAQWFTTHVWPLIRKVRPQGRLYLVGRDPVPALTAMNGKDGITVTGTVDDPGEWIARATVSIAPIRAAAGLQNKLLEALAMARPVVCTSVANEGIGAVPDRDLVIADEPQAMAAAILTLIDDKQRRTELGQNGRRFVEQKWTWEGPFLLLEEEILKARRDI